MSEEGGGEVEELRAQIQELQQRLMMAEQAVNDNEGEVKDLHEAIECTKEDHRNDFEREKE